MRIPLKQLLQATPLVALLWAATCSSQTSKPGAGGAPKDSVEQLFSKKIAPNELVVVTRQRLDAKRLGNLGARIADQHAAVACIRVELYTGADSPVLLASAIQPDYKDFRRGFNVIDVFPEPDELVVACTMRDLVGLWRISLDLHLLLPDGWTWVWPGENAVMVPFGHDKVAIKMRLSAKAGSEKHWHLTITDLRGPTPITTQYEQVPRCWRFREGEGP